jgi:hypothetical protein
VSTVIKVRVCPICGTENSARASDCSKCGADILGEPLETRYPDAVTGEPATLAVAPKLDAVGPHVVLEVLERPDLSFVVEEDKSVGRTEAADIILKGVPYFDYISRRMATFSRRGEQWFVKHVATSNYIVVDGEKYESDDDIALHDGSVLGLPLCQFMVRIPVVDTPAESEAAPE